MADVADMAAEIEVEHVAAAVARAIEPIPAGAPGECEGCGYWMPRLVGDRCGFCRDGRARPANWVPPEPPTAAAIYAAEEEKTMAAKTISMPASAGAAIKAVEEYADANDLSFGNAAAALIELGAEARPGPVPAPVVDPDRFSLADLLEMIRERFDDLPDQSADLAAAIERAETAEARADAAEAKLARAKELFA